MAANKPFDFNTEAKELHIGKSFLKGYKDEFFHTIRYDFKPASVDNQKVGTMEIDDKEVTLSVPHVESAGVSQAAVFKGNKTPALKECVLVIDHVTGKIVLERISSNIRVKKTRAEKIKKELHSRKDHNWAGQASHDTFAHKASSGPYSARGNYLKPSNAKGHSPNSGKPVTSSAAAPGSMPLLSLDENKNDSMMSESSSDSDSGSSSSSDSDSDSDHEQPPRSQSKSLPNNNTLNGLGASTPKSPTSILSDLELSEED